MIRLMGIRSNLQTTLHVMAEMIRAWSMDERIITLARQIVAPHPKGATPESVCVEAWIRDHIRYTQDPAHGDMIQDPILTLQLGTADCDCMVTLAGALLASLGHEVVPCAIRWRGETDPSHAVLSDHTAGRVIDPVAAPGTWPPSGYEVAAAIYPSQALRTLPVLGMASAGDSWFANPWSVQNGGGGLGDDWGDDGGDWGDDGGDWGDDGGDWGDDGGDWSDDGGDWGDDGGDWGDEGGDFGGDEGDVDWSSYDAGDSEGMDEWTGDDQTSEGEGDGSEDEGTLDQTPEGDASEGGGTMPSPVHGGGGGGGGGGSVKGGGGSSKPTSSGLTADQIKALIAQAQAATKPASSTTKPASGNTGYSTSDVNALLASMNQQPSALPSWALPAGIAAVAAILLLRR